MLRRGGLFERFVKGRLADFQTGGRLAHGEARCDVPSRLAQFVGGDDWPTASLAAALARSAQARLGALADQIALELRQGAEDVEHQHASRRGGVDVLGERAEPDASGRHLADLLDQVTHRAAESIELPDHQRVAGAKIGQRFGKTGPVGSGTRRPVVENTFASGSPERVVLERELLVGGRDAGIADQCHVPPHRVRFPIIMRSCPNRHRRSRVDGHIPSDRSTDV